MKAIEFPQVNCMLAENQPQYETLPVFVESKAKQFRDPERMVNYTKQVAWSMTACFELSEEEIAEIVKTKKLWHTQLIMGHNFQPIIMSTQNPFIHEKSNDNGGL